MSKLSRVTANSILIGIVVSLVFAGCAKMALAQDIEIKPLAGLGPTGAAKEVQGRFAFTEGPAANRQGVLFFSDVPASKVYRVEPNLTATVFREQSGRTNGQMFNGQGELLGCEMVGRIVAVSPTGDVRVLADKYDGKRFNAPNDLVVDRTGGVYFTDPDFFAPQPLPQGTMGVYYIAPDGKVTRVVESLPKPNGVILSIDEKTLYVVPTGQAGVMAYPVTAPGQLGDGKVFCELRQKEGQTNGGGDGLTIDTKGNLYIAAATGLQVFSPAGEYLGELAFPKQPANATFGGADGKTLYVTARSSVYVVPMEAQGHAFPGGEK